MIASFHYDRPPDYASPKNAAVRDATLLRDELITSNERCRISMRFNTSRPSRFLSFSYWLRGRYFWRAYASIDWHSQLFWFEYYSLNERYFLYLYLFSFDYRLIAFTLLAFPALCFKRFDFLYLIFAYLLATVMSSMLCALYLLFESMHAFLSYSHVIDEFLGFWYNR